MTLTGMTLLLLVACTSDPGAPGNIPVDSGTDSADTAEDSGDSPEHSDDPCTWATTWDGPADADWLFSATEVVALAVHLPQDSVDTLGALTDGGSKSACGALTTPYGVLAPVQISLRGKVDNSFQPLDGKPYLQLDFADTGTTLSGLTRLRLYNQWQDQSGLQRYLGYQMWRAAEYPAPRAGFARLTLDGRDLGIVGTAEYIERAMLARWPEVFTSVDTIFEGEYGNDFNDVGAMEVKEGTADWDRLRELATVVMTSPDLATDLRPHMAPELWYRHWALEVAVGAQEGYTFETNNWFLVHDASADRFTMVPWGFDQVLVASVGTADTEGLLPSHGMAQAPYLRGQCTALRDIRGEVDWEGLRDDLHALDAVVSPDEAIEGLDNFTADEVRAGRALVDDYLTRRPAELDRFITENCPGE